MKNYKFLDTILNEIKEKPGFSCKTLPGTVPGPDDKLFTQLYSTFLDAVNYVNKAWEKELISIDNLSVEIFKLVLNSEQFNACFYMLSRGKYVFVFNEDSGQISFFGRHKAKNDPDVKVNRNFIQLFKLNCALIDGTIKYKDNTGNELSSKEVIYQIIRWLLS